jgi:hypothetical protein
MNRDRICLTVYNSKRMRNPSDVVHQEQTAFDLMSVRCKGRIGLLVRGTRETLDLYVQEADLEAIP